MACAAHSSLRVLAVNSSLNPAFVTMRGSSSLKLPAPPRMMTMKRFCTTSAVATSATAQENIHQPPNAEQDTQEKQSSALQETKPSSISPLALNLMDQFNPFRATTSSLKSVLDFMDRLVDETSPTAFRRVPWDVVDDDKFYKVRIDIPGFGKDDVKVHIEDGVLVIDAEERKEEGDEDKWTSQSRRSFHTRVALPKNIEPDTVCAKMKHGVLEVTIPKTKVEKKVQEVEVE